MLLTAAVIFLAFSSLAFAQEESVPKASATASLETSSASPDVLNRILALIADSGTDSELVAGMAGALGFTKTGQPWDYRLIGVRADESDSSSPMHIFGVGRGNDEDLLIYVLKDGRSHFIRANRNMQVVRAISVDTAKDEANLIATADAQSEVNDELQFWERNTERTAHWRACMGELKGATPVAVQKKIEGCTWLIQSGKESPPGLAMAYANRGIAYQGDNKQKEKEMEDLNQAVKVDPTSASAWALLCSAQNWDSEEKQFAMQSCSKAIELDPHSPAAWTFRGDIHLRGKDYDLAIADYDHAIELNPNWMWPLDNRGEAYLRKNQIDRAIEDFKSVIRVSPAYAMGFLDRGIAEMRKNDLDAALADFQAGIKVDPKCAPCIFGQGLVKRAKGDRAGGDADIATAKTQSPKAADNFIEDGILVP